MWQSPHCEPGKPCPWFPPVWPAAPWQLVHPVVQLPPAQYGVLAGAPLRPFEWHAPVQVPRALVPLAAVTVQVVPFQIRPSPKKATSPWWPGVERSALGWYEIV